MSAIYKHGNAEIQGNLTPMIDMAFLLIVFFVLVSRIVDIQSADMDLPRPTDALTQRQGDESRLVINIMPAAGSDGRASSYRVGTLDFPADALGIQAMTQAVTDAYSRNPMVSVNVRADRRVHFEHVEPALQAVSSAARLAMHSAGRAVPARVNLVVVQEN